MIKTETSGIIEISHAIEIAAILAAIIELDRNQENFEDALAQQTALIYEVLSVLGVTTTTGSDLEQTNGGIMAGPYSIQAGKTGTFLRSNLPVGSLGLFKGSLPTYTPDDPAVVLGPDASDPTNVDKFSVAVPATDTGASFNLSITITPANADGTAGTPITNGPFNVTITQVTPPGVVTTASDLTQTS